MSQIDRPKEAFDSCIWDNPFNPHYLKPGIRSRILNILKYAIREFPEYTWDMVSSVILTGSLVTNQFTEKSDLDVNVGINPFLYERVNHRPWDREEMREKLYPILSQIRPINSHQIQYFIISDDCCLEGDGFYDILGNKWIKGPIWIPLSFNPDKEFKDIRKEAKFLADKFKKLSRQEKDEILNEIYKIREEEFANPTQLVGLKLSNDWSYFNIKYKYFKKYTDLKE